MSLISITLIYCWKDSLYFKIDRKLQQFSEVNDKEDRKEG
jgi:hypothetical protein